MDGTQTYIDQDTEATAGVALAGKRIYLAMPTTDFGTVVEMTVTREIEETYGWQVVSPNHPDHQAAYAIEGMGPQPDWPKDGVSAGTGRAGAS